MGNEGSVHCVYPSNKPIIQYLSLEGYSQRSYHKMSGCQMGCQGEWVSLLLWHPLPVVGGTYFLWLVGTTSYGWWEPLPMVGGTHFLWLVGTTSYGWWAPLPMVGGNHFPWLVVPTSYGWYEPLPMVGGNHFL